MGDVLQMRDENDNDNREKEEATKAIGQQQKKNGK